MCYSLALATVSSFFAQLIGIYLILVCLAELVQTERFKKILHAILGQPTSLFAYSVVNILAALSILIPHNLWMRGWPVLITLIGWLMLVKGVLSLFFPEKYVKLCTRFTEKSGFKIWSWIWLFVGLYLVWMGLAYNM